MISNDSRLNDPETHAYHKCCCSPEAHCWWCGEDEAEHTTVLEEERVK